jgi:hypothetical protein
MIKSKAKERRREEMVEDKEARLKPLKRRSDKLS